jgi:hypothetical protein
LRKVIKIKDGNTGVQHNLGVKAFLSGSLAGDEPTVTIVVSSEQGQVLGHFDIDPEEAHILSEYVRTEAELAAKIKEELTA